MTTPDPTSSLDHIKSVIESGDELAAIEWLSVANMNDKDKWVVANRLMLAHMTKALELVVSTFDHTSSSLANSMLWTAASEGYSDSFPCLFQHVTPLFKNDVLARCAQFGDIDGMRQAIALGAEIEGQEHSLAEAAGSGGKIEALQFLCQHFKLHSLAGRLILDPLIMEGKVQEAITLIPYVKVDDYFDCLLRAAHTRYANEEIFEALFAVNDATSVFQSFEAHGNASMEGMRTNYPLLWTRWKAQQDKQKLIEALDEPVARAPQRGMKL